MSYISFPENLLIIPGLAPVVGGDAEATSIPISLKNVQKLWAVVYVNTAGTSAAVACVPQIDELVAFGGAGVLVNTIPIWANEAAGTADLWTKQTDAVNFSTTADAASKMVVFEIDPASLRADATNLERDEDCFRISLTTVAAGDYAAVFYIVQPRYISKSDTRSYITD